MTDSQQQSDSMICTEIGRQKRLKRKLSIYFSPFRPAPPPLQVPFFHRLVCRLVDSRPEGEKDRQKGSLHFVLWADRICVCERRRGAWKKADEVDRGISSPRAYGTVGCRGGGLLRGSRSNLDRRRRKASPPHLPFARSRLSLGLRVGAEIGPAWIKRPK